MIPTRQNPTEIPYYEDFRTSNHGWNFYYPNLMNYFEIDTNDTYPGHNGLYITSKESLPGEYNASISSQTYAIRTIHLKPGFYRASYYWKTDGLTPNDFGRVVFTDEDYWYETTGVFVTSYRWHFFMRSKIIWCYSDLHPQHPKWKKTEETCLITQESNYVFVIEWKNSDSEGFGKGLMIDSIAMEIVPHTLIIDTACLGYEYMNHGFKVP